MVTQFAEVLAPKPQQRGAVELSLASDAVLDSWVESVAGLVMPGLVRAVLGVDEDRLRAPVVLLPSQPVAALEQQNSLARRSQPVGEAATAGRASHHDGVVLVVDDRWS